MRHHAHLVIVLAPMAFVVGCPSTATTPPTIDDVVVDGDPGAEDFSLDILGHGFTTDVSYDLSSQSGQASSSVKVELFEESSAMRVPADPHNTRVTSPGEILVTMTDPLSPGVWGVRLWDAARSKVLTEKENAFRVDGIDPEDDAGIAPDADDNPDAGETADTGGGAPDAIVDAGIPDTGVPPDSGLGPFVGNFQYRQQIKVTNPSAAEAAAGTTILIPVLHASLMASAMVKADATDIAIYQGPNELQYQWDDRVLIGTDQLVMVAKLILPLPVGPNTAEQLVLYFGDPNATIDPTDEVFVFSERFANNVSGDWFVNNRWSHCGFNRPSEMQTPDGAYCAQDGGNNPTLGSLATPTQDLISMTGVTANQKYALSLWTAGLMVSQTNDLMYFAMYDQNDQFENTTLIPATEWTGFLPNVSGFTFIENNNQPRTVEGWRYAATTEWWRRSEARFVPPYTTTSLHLRFLSKDNNDNGATFVALDDMTVRIALDPDFVVAPNAVEHR